MQGVHPHDCKLATNQLAVEQMPITEGDEFFLSLTQHIGAPAKPIVKKGQEVKAGELIAEAGGFVSANVHSPVDGVVTAIDRCDYPVSAKAPCIVIKAGVQSGTWVKIDESITGLADIAKAAGLTGMGGAGFPAHVKLTPPNQLETLLINGAECEPYLTCDHRAMLERAEDLISGALLVKEALKLQKVIFGIEANKPDAAKAIEAVADGRVEVKLLPMLYPQGGEKQLIYSCTGKEVPEGKLPSELAIIVHNISTILAIHDAVMERKPVISRVVTVTGAVTNPKNILAPLGTPISRLIDYCGGIKLDSISPTVVLGGPMTGFTAHSLAIPSYKGMNGVLVLEKTEAEPNPLPCIRCGRCLRACPMGLSPLALENFARNNMLDELFDAKLSSCIQCSACNYVCPSKRPLKKIFRLEIPKMGEIMKRRQNG
ncbi:MAG: electron transport complex subunit RsxC [Deferribacteraceae bacterium]|jgi:electron transport complex protein RnfC|nr:electron transport complex subunit RsxC [Deferribacteraceae bacterium]